MKNFALFLLLIIVACGGTGMVEVGMNDGPARAAVLADQGDLVIRVWSIEIPLGDGYSTLWQGPQDVQVSIGAEDFQSITFRFIEIEPGSYDHFRLTVDSVRHVQDALEVMVVDTSYQFEANAFTSIVIEEDDEFQLVVGVNAARWFDATAQPPQIIDGHVAFEGATLKIFYE